MKLTGYEAKVLQAWEGTGSDFGVLSFRAIAVRAEIDLSKVRRAVRALARKGLTKYVRVSWTDEGELYGAGYDITEAGRSALRKEERG